MDIPGLGWLTGPVADALTGSVFAEIAEMTQEALGVAVGSVGTAWVHIGVPVLSSSPGAKTPGVMDAAGVSSTYPVLDWVAWGGAVLAVLALICLAMLMMRSSRAGDGAMAIGRMGAVLVAVGLLGAAGPIARAVVGRGPRGVAGAAAFIQSSLWGWLLVLVLLSVMVGAIRIIIDQRMEPAKDLLRSILTLITVTAVGTTMIGLLIAATDKFSVWILSRSLECNAADASCFGEGLTSLLVIGGPATMGGGLGMLLVIIMGLLAVCATLLQIVLLVARGAMLVVLTGVLPLTASFTNTGMGRTWFNRSVAWVIALILYKPVAAIIYATAFKLVGDGASGIFPDRDDPLLTLAAGVVLMVLALIAMPALMRFITPAVGAVISAGGGGVAMGAGMAVASGAQTMAYGMRGAGQASRTPQQSPSGNSGGGSPTPAASQGAPGGPGSPGSPGAPGTGTAGAPGAIGADGGTHSSTGAGGAPGAPGTTAPGAPPGGGTPPASGAAPVASGAAGGAAGAGAAGAGGAAAAGGGATAAGAAAAPATGGASLVIAAGAQAGMQVSQAIAKGASDVAENTADGAQS
ncbi:hypothetical protein [Demequina litorisediminis]|uniref:TrbL/VirB6 plasmid conjugal transfer protein n=1 Tax=Demequina litorisediminis TaxID=1849022 RepID=A0ABQ6IKL2_9MICO|nr:hypothetical protein [Demequina litorisediminis]GMA37815.1 hypothetical protein GCM10025876_40190 [Demequina litorisediminis]GMA37875.1 hypothetical protein GCM10025876_40790 [Demequina litorisediminis]GMA37920.1 hypothetical protein GCM10025876_41240 [Demequina litorisediminis]